MDGYTIITISLITGPISMFVFSSIMQKLFDKKIKKKLN